tara:strand:+ start:1312 stop:1491 length:180 start_codon:yes stop_codon:yes gene_type:complete
MSFIFFGAGIVVKTVNSVNGTLFICPRPFTNVYIVYTFWGKSVKRELRNCWRILNYPSK